MCVLQRSAADVLVDTLRESFTMVGLVGLAFYTDWKLASIAFIVLPVTILPAALISRKIRENTKRGQRRVGELNSVLQETISGVKVIKAFGKEQHENKKFQMENRKYYKLLRKVLKYESMSSPFVELIASFGVAGVFWYGINRVIAGDISQGELFSFVAAILMMFVPLKRLIRVNNVFQKSMGAAERIFEILDEKARLPIRRVPERFPEHKASSNLTMSHLPMMLKWFSTISASRQILARKLHWSARVAPVNRPLQV